jgi:hypothetical protein
MSSRLNQQLNKLNEQTDDILSLPGFKSDIDSLRNKWNIPIDGLKESETANSWRLRLSDKEQANFDQDIRDIVDKHGLSPSWQRAVTAYVLINQLAGGWLGVVVGHSFDKDNNIVDLHIKLEKDSTLKDVEDVWSMVERFQKKMPGRFDKNYRAKKPENKKRDATVMKLRAEGLDYQQITDETGLAYPDIATIIRNNKKRQSKP